MTKIKVRQYSLPDSELYSTDTKLPNSKIWIPAETCIVLGKSNNPVNSIFIGNNIAENIPVYKRPSGGETVVLSPNMLVISAVVKQTGFKSGKTYFRYFNNIVIKSLQKLKIKNLYCKGISDISINDKKILGSAIYQNKNIVFYHAVLNVCERVELIEKYLQHPIREPDYRQSRNHIDFVTSLRNEGYSIKYSILKTAIEVEFAKIEF